MASSTSRPQGSGWIAVCRFHSINRKTPHPTTTIPMMRKAGFRGAGFIETQPTRSGVNGQKPFSQVRLVARHALPQRLEFHGAVLKAAFCKNRHVETGDRLDAA